MEDKHVAFEDLNPLLESGDGLPPQAFFGVYDGHGGVEAASFSAMQLHHIVASQPSFAENVLLSCGLPAFFVLTRMFCASSLAQAFKKAFELPTRPSLRKPSERLLRAERQPAQS